nr:tudor domain-containing protein 7B-like [Oncorhynchus nerka]
MMRGSTPPAPAPTESEQGVHHSAPNQRCSLKKYQEEIKGRVHLSSGRFSGAPSVTISNVSAPPPTPKALQPGGYNPQVVQSRISEVLKKYYSGLWLSKLPCVYRNMHNQVLPGQAVIDLENWTHICSVKKPVSTNRADRLVYPPQPNPPQPCCRTSQTRNGPLYCQTSDNPPS